MSFLGNFFGRSKEEQFNNRFDNLTNNRRDIDFNVQNNISALHNSIDYIVSKKSVLTDTLVSKSSNAVNPDELPTVDSLFPVHDNKADRLRQYYQLSNYPDINWCLNEIITEFINPNISNSYIKINNISSSFDNSIDSSNVKLIIENEFERFINLFNLQDNLDYLLKMFFVTGELAFENQIDTNHPEQGILGINFIPPEYYTLAINENTNTYCGILLNTEMINQQIQYLKSSSYLTSYANIIRNFGVYQNAGTIASGFDKQNSTFLPFSQVTYANINGVVENKNIITNIIERFQQNPLLELCKQPFLQLNLMIDAAVILRVTRAPERLLFNVNTGGMSDKVAEDYVRQFGNKLRSKKTLGSNRYANGEVSSNNVSNRYNPSTMLEAWIFGKSEANGGTDVTSVSSQANYDQLDDIQFFQKRLLKVFQIPWSRFSYEDRTSTFASARSHDSLTYEEYGFAKFVIKFQNIIASSIKRSFFTHLILRGITDKYNLSITDFNIEFNRPTHYELDTISKELDIRVNMYNSIVGNDEFSKTQAMKKYLNMTEEEIRENTRARMMEKNIESLGDNNGEENVSDKLISMKKHVDDVINNT